MIKIYFDWNVLSQIKNGKHTELKEIIFNDDKLFIPFSTSHIGDILSSFKETDEQKEFIKSDLEFISNLTGNKCLVNTNEDIILDFCSPQELFQQRVNDKNLFNDLSLKGLMSIFDQDESTKMIGKNFINLLKSIPLDDSFKKAFENPKSAEQINKIFPGLEANPTMEGFFESFNKMTLNLNESDTYGELRKSIQNGIGINRDRIFNINDPYKIIDDKYKKLGGSPDDYINKSKNAPEWFNKISNAYILLDMHGYQEDKINIGKGRKETFKNTTEDSFHSAFASTCNFYVINDNKSYKKTKVIYKKLNINTLVLKPSEFVEHYQKFLDIKNQLFSIKLIFKIIQSQKYYEEKMEDSVLRTYFVPFFFFGFFNKIMMLLPDDNENITIILSQNGPSSHTVYAMEVRNLVGEICNLFGNDLDNYGEVKDEEFIEKEWKGRKWQIDNYSFRLIRLNGLFQFYFDELKT
ncbi:hypothetical protein [Lacinutrix himadriensis]|uniref:hypothetical protein n=1 Tax=Lacinutrix himadriensis TaxID=641549 RepID=UPI0006E12678|nr:hypothetical protein [Lacinutrix himadriensis]